MTQTLIEQWLPAQAIGAESLRERGTPKAFPPINFLHVWWARRPLTASRAAVLASILPAWPSVEEAANDPRSATVAAALGAEFPDGEKHYHAWFLQTLGIMGDPVTARAAIKAANIEGLKLPGNPYGYPRAFTTTPDQHSVETIHRLASLLGEGSAASPSVLDPFAGGGSIPFEAARLGCDTYANELNPVATAILKGTVVLPAALGAPFAKTISEWGGLWAERIRKRLDPYFPRQDGETIAAYIWAHTVPCPTTGRPTPLAPDFWLARGKAGRDVAVALEVDKQSGAVELSIVQGRDAAQWGRRSTYKGGAAESIWTGETISGDYIRTMSTQCRMGQMLLALCVTRSGAKGRNFRAPTNEDSVAITAAVAELARSRPAWEIEDLVPTDSIDSISNYDRGHRMYGINQFADFFAPRQLLANVTALEELHSIVDEARTVLGDEPANALSLYLAFALDKMVDYNSRQCSWDATRVKVRSTFDKHNFNFKWSFAEFDAAHELAPWAVKNAVANHTKICSLVAQDANIFSAARSVRAEVSRGSAAHLALADQSVDAIVTDPPYYDNVMYAECSDFFYVWLKRSLRHTWPGLTDLVLTEKQAEAVANRALFKDVASPRRGKRKTEVDKSASELADERYEGLLKLAFREAHRVLKPSGVLTVMFTHKRVDAWDTLGAALLDAGFSINASWPVHTESEVSTHQAKVNAASSTIFLACRKRDSSSPAYWADIRSQVERAAEEAASRFASEGMTGVDLTIATYGPVLSVLSESWPVYTGELSADGQPEVLRPDAALDLARERVATLKKRGLLGGRDVEFDRVTDWFLLAWSDFRAAQFPFDEARKLCIATHLEFDDLASRDKIVKATSGSVTLLTPAQRRTAGALDPDVSAFPNWIDCLHALMLIYDEEGLPAARAWLARTGMGEDSRFADLLQAALTAIPRVKDKGQFVRSEARILDSLRTALFDQIPVPADATAPQSSKGLFEIDGELGFSVPGQLGYEEEEAAAEGAE